MVLRFRDVPIGHRFTMRSTGLIGIMATRGYRKISPRKYVDDCGNEYKVGTVSVEIIWYAKEKN